MKHPRRGPRAVSASALAQLGVCEERLVLEHRHGAQRTPAQDTAIRRGRRAHTRFFERGLRAHPGAQTSDPRPCLVASAALGEHHPVTQALRRFRDEILHRYWAGRAMIVCYYAISPAAARAVAARPLLRRVVRWVLVAAARRAQRLLEKRALR